MAGLRGQSRVPQADVRSRRNFDNLADVLSFIGDGEVITINDDGVFTLVLGAAGGLVNTAGELGIGLDTITGPGLNLSGDGLRAALGFGLEFDSGNIALSRPVASPDVGGTTESEVFGTGAYISAATATDGRHNTVIGAGAYVDKPTGLGFRNVVVGRNARSTTFSAVVIGTDANSSGDGSIVIGPSASVAFSDSVVIGNSASAAAPSNIAIGRFAACLGNSALAFGPNTRAALNAVSIGDLAGATTTGANSVSIGKSANAGFNSIAIGLASNATNSECLAVGRGGATSGSRGIAIGAYAQTSGADAICISAAATIGTFVAASGELLVATPALSTGYMGNGKTATSPLAFTLQGTGGSGTDIAGAKFTLAGGRSTGAGLGGSVAIATAPAATSGSALNTLVDRVTVDSTGQTTIEVSARVKVGDSTSYARVGGTLVVDTTTTGNVGTGEDNLISYSIPADTFNADGDHLVVRAFGTLGETANAKRLRLKFGATTLFDSTSQTQNGGTWELTATIIRTGATTQKAIARLVIMGSLFEDSVEYTTPTETLSGAVTLVVTAEAVDDDDIVQEAMIVSYHPAP